MNFVEKRICINNALDMYVYLNCPSRVNNIHLNDVIRINSGDINTKEGVFKIQTVIYELNENKFVVKDDSIVLLNRLFDKSDKCDLKCITVKELYETGIWVKCDEYSSQYIDYNLSLLYLINDIKEKSRRYYGDIFYMNNQAYSITCAYTEVEVKDGCSPVLGGYMMYTLTSKANGSEVLISDNNLITLIKNMEA